MNRNQAMAEAVAEKAREVLRLFDERYVVRVINMVKYDRKGSILDHVVLGVTRQNPETAQITPWITSIALRRLLEEVPAIFCVELGHEDNPNWLYLKANIKGSTL